MGSKGRIPPHHLRHPLPGPGIGHPDPFAPGLRPPLGGFAPFDTLAPPEFMEQRLAAQHVDMQKLATENQRFAATHGTLRQELAAAQHELEMLRAHIGALESERDQKMRSLMDRIAKMEADLQAAEPLKMELQQAQAEAHELFATRQELVSKVQDLSRDLQKAHSDMQQFPGLMSELENLRQEYQHCRATYDYEKKLYNDHLESLQVMEKNYLTMAREVENLRKELTNAANFDRGTGVPYGGPTVYNVNDATGHYPAGHNAYNNYGLHQGHVPLPGGSGGGAAGSPAASAPVEPAPASTSANGGTPHVGDTSETAHVGDKSGFSHVGDKSGTYDAASREPGYDAQRGFNYNAESQRGPGVLGYDAQRGFGGPVYDAQRGFGEPGYDAHRGQIGGPGGPVYDAHRGIGYEMQRGPAYDAQRGSRSDAQRGIGY